MSVSGLKGSFPLTAESIDKEVKHIAPGAFALGNLHEGKFQTLYVGRSDTNLNKTLKQCLRQTTRFKFELYDDPQDAFNKECELFHFFKPKANTQHPQRPAAQNWRCPECNFYKA
jgi:hypothetical protein